MAEMIAYIYRTVQESEACVRCVYFTEYGAYHVSFAEAEGRHFRIRHEPTAHCSLEILHGIQSGFYTDRIHSYTQRRLNFPNDILRAVSSVIYDMYESRTTFGLPWADFDRGFLWYVSGSSSTLAPTEGPDVFPSCSWV